MNAPMVDPDGHERIRNGWRGTVEACNVTYGNELQLGLGGIVPAEAEGHVIADV